MENVKNLWEELAILFNPETTMQDFATHFKVAKSIFEQQTDRSRIQNKTDDSDRVQNPQQLVMEFDEEKQKNWKEIKELCSAIWKRDNRPNAKRLRNFSDDCFYYHVIIPATLFRKLFYFCQCSFAAFPQFINRQLNGFLALPSAKDTFLRI